MEKPFIQPFKYITVTMKDKTNEGVGYITGKSDFNIVKGDKRFMAVQIDDNGLGHTSMQTPTSERGFIGVLTESFNKPMVPTQVLVQGIVPICLSTQVTEANVGKLVYLDTDAANRGKVTPTKPTTNIVTVGILLGPGNAEGYAPVLIGSY